MIISSGYRTDLPVPLYLNRETYLQRLSSSKYFQEIMSFIEQPLTKYAKNIENIYDSEIPEISGINRYARFEVYVPFGEWFPRVDIYVTRGNDFNAHLLLDVSNNDTLIPYNVVKDTIIYPSFFINVNRVDYMSIVLTISNKTINRYKIYDMLNREITKAFDLLCHWYVKNPINRDICFCYEFLSKQSDAKYKCYWNSSANEQINLVSNMSSTDIMNTLCYLIYCLNLNELNYKLYEFKRTRSETKHVSIISLNSECRVIEFYKRIEEFLICIAYTLKDDSKKNFIEQYIGYFEMLYDFENKATPHLNNPFDNFINFLINRVSMFIDKCVKYAWPYNIDELDFYNNRNS